MADPTVVRAENVLAVRSRVSWGAVFAGAVIALALYFLLSLLGSAIGLSVSNQVRADHLGIGATAWAIGALLIALFVGGWVTAQCMAGENRAEALMSGAILWGVVFAVLLWFMASSVRVGFNALMGMASAPGASTGAAVEPSAADLERAGEQAGLSKDQLDKLRAALPTTADELQRMAEDPQARQTASWIAWWAFGGTLLSLVAAMGGALAGAGPAPALLRGLTGKTFGSITETSRPLNRY